MRQQALIVFALEAEAQGLFTEGSVLFCGVGKVNAAHRLTRAIAQWRSEHHGHGPQIIINAGSAGSRVFARGAVVNCTRFIQRDMDATALGCAPFATPFDSHGAVLEGPLRVPSYPEGICGSGDSFVTGGPDHGWNVVDMEGYALAKVCREENVPFCCLKYITDGANDDAPIAWEEGLPTTARALRAAVDDAIRLVTAGR